MNRITRHAPLALLLLATIALALHGPIYQPEGYHGFADTRSLLGLANAADVLSNFGFLVVASWGLWRLASARAREALGRSHAGYVLFLAGLLMVAFGSTFYHLAPDDARLAWDRLPIALACAGLLAGAYSDTHDDIRSMGSAVALSVFAGLSVGWWAGTGDLRPYLLLQIAPLALIPLWQALHGAPARDRAAFGIAILFYLVAKVAELADHVIYEAFALVSGHTLKHLLAVGASAVIVGNLVARIRQPGVARRRSLGEAPSLWDLERLGGRGGP